jgi:uncharacterized SAM-binding protein YcdF (DUF218 family)
MMAGTVLRRSLVVLCLVAFVWFLLTPLAFYLSIGHGDTSRTHFDTLIVLGYPCEGDGRPTPEQRERVLEAVREYQHGVAPHIIMTGGAAHNRFVEAHAMKLLAVASGVPAGAIIEEDRATNTVENLYFSNEILESNGWHSAEVISSPSHLPRAALILAHYRFDWRTHAARWPHEYSVPLIAAIYAHEIAACWEIRLHGFTPGTLFPAGS